MEEGRVSIMEGLAGHAEEFFGDKVYFRKIFLASVWRTDLREIRLEDGNCPPVMLM